MDYKALDATRYALIIHRRLLQGLTCLTRSIFIITVIAAKFVCRDATKFNEVLQKIDDFVFRSDEDEVPGDSMFTTQSQEEMNALSLTFLQDKGIDTSMLNDYSIVRYISMFFSSIKLCFQLKQKNTVNIILQNKKELLKKLTSASSELFLILEK